MYVKTNHITIDKKEGFRRANRTYFESCFRKF